MLALLLISSQILALSHGFSLTAVKPKTVRIVEGQDVDLFCAVDTYYEWCTFVHNDKKCDFEWKRDVWNLTTLDCADYQDRAHFNGDYNEYNCGIKLKNVKLEDAGLWSCELESYHAGKYRGYGYQVKGEMVLEVEPKVTTTTTTTTTTTSTTSTTTSTTKTSEESEASYEYEYGTESDEDTNSNGFEGQTDSDSEQESNSAIFVVIPILILFIVAGLAIFFLHYKRKLPPAFYNLGRRQWKFVQTNEEFPVVEEDEKKHPDIVKNGKAKTDSEDVSPMGDSANVNPALTSVTWTANEAEKSEKANGNGTMANGGSAEEKAPLNNTDEKTDEEKP